MFGTVGLRDRGDWGGFGRGAGACVDDGAGLAPSGGEAGAGCGVFVKSEILNAEMKRGTGGLRDSCGWFHNADQLTGRISVGGESRMNAMGEGSGVGIVTGADDDACGSTLGVPVQADKVEPVITARCCSVAKART